MRAVHWYYWNSRAIWLSSDVMLGRVAQSVMCLATDACLTADPGVASSIPARSHTFVEIDHEIISTVILLTPASNLGYLAPPPGQFFIGAKLFIGTPWMGNEGVLKRILVWAM